MTAEEVVAKLMSDEHADFLREWLRWMVEQLMKVEVSELIGAERGERTPDRATHRNGFASGAGTRAPARLSCRPRSCSAASCLPCRRSWVRIPSAAFRWKSSPFGSISLGARGASW